MRDFPPGSAHTNGGGAWKLVRLGPDVRQVNDPNSDARIELYRIDRDPYERHNVASQNAAIVDELLAKMETFRQTQKEKLHPIDNCPPASWKPTTYRIPAH